MLWVFIALIILIVSVLVLFLQQIMEAVKNNMYVPPSNAVIDQAMPEEIIEHIFSFMDPLTFQQARNVSKYWRSNTSKNRIKVAVVERYSSAVNGSEDVQKLVSLYGKNILLTYPPKYSPDFRLRDMALAQKRGKTLLELDLGGIAGNELVNKGLLRIEKDKYILKSPATLLNNLPGFKIGVLTFTARNGAPLLPVLRVNDDQTTDRTVQYDVMLNLEEYVNSQAMHSNQASIVMCRNLTSSRNFFGFIPLDGSFVKVMIFLLLPLIVHDAINSAFMKYLKLWFGPGAFAVLSFIITQENHQALAYAPQSRNTQLYKKMILLTPLVATIGFGLFYPVSSTHFALVGIIISTFGYIFTLHDHVFIEESYFKPKSKEKLQLFIICVALILLTNDWPAAFGSFIDGTIFPRIFWNTMHFLVFLIYPIWNNTMVCILYDNEKKFRWKHLITWEADVVKLMAMFYGAALFVTLYAPHWQGNYT